MRKGLSGSPSVHLSPALTLVGDDLSQVVRYTSVCPLSEGAVFAVTSTYTDTVTSASGMGVMSTGCVILTLVEAEVVCERVECPIPDWDGDTFQSEPYTVCVYLGGGVVGVVRGKSVYLLSLDTREWQVQQGVLSHDALGSTQLACALQGKIIIVSGRDYHNPTVWEYDTLSQLLWKLPLPPSGNSLRVLEYGTEYRGSLHYIKRQSHLIYTPGQSQVEREGEPDRERDREREGEGGWVSIPMGCHNHGDVAALGRYLVYPHEDTLVAWDSVSGVYHNIEMPEGPAGIYQLCERLVKLSDTEV
ncbi:hypothetical protein KIPB_000939 [Kipferlia bialata]|uniref:Uncharacterized protein n=1 Tax=Kipferlia bialata TaxID=797122 RepID=A0A9K3CPK6_9EUKA|nr:hypothetical protein KIPB_000939 [Kipferlia bialata]|eukprot:g939.t1